MIRIISLIVRQSSGLCPFSVANVIDFWGETPREVYSWQEDFDDYLIIYIYVYVRKLGIWWLE